MKDHMIENMNIRKFGIPKAQNKIIRCWLWLVLLEWY